MTVRRIFSAPGRAFVTRTALGAAGVEYTDKFMTWGELVEARGEAGATPEIPLGQLPVLTLPSGRVVCQSGAMARYAAKKVLFKKNRERNI